MYCIGSYAVPQILSVNPEMDIDSFVFPASDNAEDNVLTEDGKLNYRTLKPVLFEMPTYEYLKTGDVIGKCMSFGKEKKD